MERLTEKSLEEVKEKITAPYVHCQLSTLGGIERASLILHTSLDKKEEWINGIYQNSRYYIFHIDFIGIVENYSRGNNTNMIRKKRVDNLQEAIDYINKNLSKEILTWKKN